jgi:hypothetical protein
MVQFSSQCIRWTAVLWWHSNSGVFALVFKEINVSLSCSLSFLVDGCVSDLEGFKCECHLLAVL